MSQKKHDHFYICDNWVRRHPVLPVWELMRRDTLNIWTGRVAKSWQKMV